MILRILVLICAVFVSLSMGRLDSRKFAENFEDMCFQNEEKDPFRVNGQDKTLSNTIENFISLAEKFEAANPSFDLKDELTYFLSEYVYENIVIYNRRVNKWEVDRADFSQIYKMWDPEVDGYRSTYKDPFTNDEKCSLYHMISHSILDKDVPIERSYSPGNFSSGSSRIQRTEINVDDYFPQEVGVVAIRGTDGPVSLSKVLKGLFVGLKQERTTDITSYEEYQKLNIPFEQVPVDKNVDALYMVTMADVLMRTEWSGSTKPGLAPNGRWVSIPINSEKKIDGFCPMVYLQESPKKFLPAYSYSSVRGAADGIILGLGVHKLYSKKSNTRLSQILRMYYSPSGISFDSQLEDINANHISFCQRQRFVDQIEMKLQEQMKLYGYLVAQSVKDVSEGYPKAKSLYDKEKQTIFRESNPEFSEYCRVLTSLEDPELLPHETNLDIVVVMDTQNSENSFQEQQMIIGYLAKYLDLRYTGSRMTIFLDRKNNSVSGSSAKIELESVVYDTYSSSCAACVVGQILLESSSSDTSPLETDQTIAAIDQFLQERKTNESKSYGVNGKVVIYFNYENKNGRTNNNKVQGSLEKALRDFHLRHQDIVFYAVGLDSELLYKYAKNEQSLIFLGTDGTPEEVAKKIFQKISFAPTLLQYSECEDERSDKTVSYESLVSARAIQHYKMPAEYFYKSLKISFKFESQNGIVRVCHNRATPKPENEIKNCKDTAKGSFVEFQITNPCKGFSKLSCSPFYFSVIGNHEIEPNLNYCNDLNDKWCANLDQVKFKVSHTGVRCSGCLGLGAVPAVILLAILLSHFLQKRF